MNPSTNDGSGTLSLHSADASKAYALQFCPQSGAGCTALGNFKTDASGGATFTFNFSQAGVWVG